MSTSTTLASQPNIDKLPTPDEIRSYNNNDIPTNYPIAESYFPVLLNDNILRVATGQHTQRTPIWCHRQAGRYLQEFRDVRSKIGFFDLCQTPNMCAEVTIQPIRKYDFDAAIIFSDILVILQCIGLNVTMSPGYGPQIHNNIKTPDDMSNINFDITTNDIHNNLSYVYKAITITRKLLNGVVPLIGFSGAPFTLFAYMVEGGGSKTYNNTRAWFYKYKTETHKILSLLTNVITQYLIRQVEAGAQMLELFDSWADQLSYDIFVEFSLPYLKQIVSNVKSYLRNNNLHVVPITIFPRGCHYCYELIAKHTEYDVISLDWAIDRKQVRQTINSISSNDRLTKRTLSIQGNLDVSVLYSSDDEIRKQTRLMLDQFGTKQYIANLGHGMLPDHDPNKLAVFIDEIHKYSELLNSKSTTDINTHTQTNNTAYS